MTFGKALWNVAVLILELAFCSSPLFGCSVIHVVVGICWLRVEPAGDTGVPVDECGFTHRLDRRIGG